jgi:hypothetical protein
MLRTGLIFVALLGACQDTLEVATGRLEGDNAGLVPRGVEPAFAPAPVPRRNEALLLSLSFDEDGAQVTDEATTQPLSIRGPRPDERLPGVQGQALALDGSTWLERPLEVAQQPTEAFTASAWLALTSVDHSTRWADCDRRDGLRHRKAGAD